MFNFKQITGTLKGEGILNEYENNLKRYSNEIEMPETGMIIKIVAWNEQAERLHKHYRQGDEVTLQGSETTKTNTNKFSETYEFHEFKVKGFKLPRKKQLIAKWDDEEIHQHFLLKNNLSAKQFKDLDFNADCQKFIKRMEAAC